MQGCWGVEGGKGCRGVGVQGCRGAGVHGLQPVRHCGRRGAALRKRIVETPMFKVGHYIFQPSFCYMHFFRGLRGSQIRSLAQTEASWRPSQDPIICRRIFALSLDLASVLYVSDTSPWTSLWLSTSVSQALLA